MKTESPNLTVALSQSTFQLDQPQANLHKVDCICGTVAAQGAKVVAFPEAALTGSIRHLPNTPALQEHALRIPGPESDALVAIAARHKVAIVVGTFELDDTGQLRNSVLVITADGCLGTYRKLFPAPGEVGLTTPGMETPVFELFGWRFGIAICWDLYFPEVARSYALQGADVLLVPTGGTGLPPEQIDNPELKTVFNRAGFMKVCPARALDNGMYVLVPVAQDAGGGSVAVDPAGEQMLAGDAAEDLFLVTLDRNRYNRAVTPYLSDLRRDIYEHLLSVFDRTQKEQSHS